jgi:hypothetical protein
MLTTVVKEVMIDKGGLQKKAYRAPINTPRATLVQYIVVSGLNLDLIIHPEVENP